MLINKRKLPAMHQAYGVCPVPHKCRECSNFLTYVFRSRKVFKCAAYGDTASQATDWGANYLACGMFNVPMDNFTPLFDKIRQQKSDGQCEMWGGE